MLTYEIARLFALDVVEKNSAKNYIDWALDSLQKGAQETAIAILAGMPPATSYFEAKECFIQAINELGIEEPETGDKLDLYIETVAKEILAGRAHYGEFLDFAQELQSQRIKVTTKYDLTNLDCLYHALQDLDDEDQSWSYHYDGVNVLNPAQTVRLECEIILGIAAPEASPRYAQQQGINERVLSGKAAVKQKELRLVNLAIDDSLRKVILFLIIAVILIWGVVDFLPRVLFR